MSEKNRYTSCFRFKQIEIQTNFCLIKYDYLLFTGNNWDAGF